MDGLPDILSEIITHKRRELARSMAAVPLADLKAQAADAPPPRDMLAALRRTPGGPVRVLAEIKRRSPSAGLIRDQFDPARLAALLAAAGADALSVLTDEKYFGGRLEFLADVRRAAPLPVLRKDFLIDPYQVWEARAWGADAFLLIADALEAPQLADLAALGRQLAMEPLVEAHSDAALDRAIASGAPLLGINNRDLHTFNVDLATTERLAPRVPHDRVLVSESGIATRDDVARLLAAGAHAVLVGESLMRAADPAAVLRDFKSPRP